MKVKLLNLDQINKLVIVKAVKELEKCSLREAKDRVDDLVKNALSTTVESVIDKSSTKSVLDDLGINYVFIDEDKCPNYEDIKGAGTYIALTGDGIQLVVIANIPAEEPMVSQIKETFRDAKFKVYKSEYVTEKGQNVVRFVLQRIFNGNILKLSDITEFATNAEVIFRAHWLKKECEEQSKKLEEVIREAFRRIE